MNATCKNGASCEDGLNNYTCVCVAGFRGDHCETGTDRKIQQAHLVFLYIHSIHSFVHSFLVEHFVELVGWCVRSFVYLTVIYMLYHTEEIHFIVLSSVAPTCRLPCKSH